MNFGPKFPQQAEGFLVTPMIDVIFLLLLFFMSTSVFAEFESEMDITLPQASEAAPQDRAPYEIIINVKADGTIVVNQRTLTLDELEDMLGKVADIFQSQEVIIRGDTATPMGMAIDVLNVCAKVGVHNVSFATIAPEDAPA